MPNQSAKFVTGSTMRHILVMSGAGSVGLMALFVVDLLDMLFISMLGQVELAAAVGFAGTLVFFPPPSLLAPQSQWVRWFRKLSERNNEIKLGS